ncbi:MAG: sigma-70 family RNA polymerase sigma factor [Myxococcales bacterium]|nr:sigma-70 family RNA polymerase sigma factor [Myxococcales bacterium]
MTDCTLFSSLPAAPTDLLAPSDWTDRELLERMLEREAKAWREFHRRFDRLIYRCIHKVTVRFRSVVTEEDVEEIFCQLLVDLSCRDMHKLRAYEPQRGNKLSSWIGLLATNAAWDYLRGVARRPRTSEVAEAEHVQADDPTPHDELVAKERWALVNEALRDLSSKDRRFVELYYVEGLAPEEVAEQLHVSVKTVYSKKHKIRSRLERMFVDASVAA